MVIWLFVLKLWIIIMRNLQNGFRYSDKFEKVLEYLKNKNYRDKKLPVEFLEDGLFEDTLEIMVSNVLGKATYLDTPLSLAHMDPPTPWITWVMSLYNARLNQNLLHQELSPFASEAERLAIEWIKPFFGMGGGHLCSGSTIANLTALWVARDSKNIKKVVTSNEAHISIEKAAKILGLEIRKVKVDDKGRIDKNYIGDLSDSCLVLTAGTTCRGAIDPMELITEAKYTHIDGAWAASLRFSPKYEHLLDGIEKADSISVSAHKWLYQPKDSAIILFRDNQKAREIMSFGSSYLSRENVGIQGSKGANGVNLLATLLFFGKKGIAKLIEHSFEMSKRLRDALHKIDNIEIYEGSQSAILLFRVKNLDTDEFLKRVPRGMFSSCKIGSDYWIRAVALNPLADIWEIVKEVKKIV